MVPWTPDRLAVHDSLGERTVIVRAVRANREDRVALPDQHDFVLARMAGHSAGLGQFVKRNAV